MNKKKKYYCIDSFCGAGGLSLGLMQAGFKVIYAFDYNDAAVKTYNKYFTDHHCAKIKAEDVHGEEVLKKSKISIGELDLFAGGPPCQGFSRQKRGAHKGDERNKLVLQYARLVEEMQPKFFLLENVDMLGQKRGKLLINEVEKRLKNYILHPHFYNSADYGVAQTRKRFIIIGKREDIDEPFEIPKHTVKRWQTLKHALKGIPEPPEDYSVHPKIYNHQKARVTPINIERFSHVKPGGGWLDIPFKLRLKCHQKVDTSKGGWPDVYGRLEWDGQCPTITAGFDSFTRGRYGHPDYNRALTPREAARLQGFPDDFEFLGNKSEVRLQIGNAVPVPLAMAIGKSIIKNLKNI